MAHSSEENATAENNWPLLSAAAETREKEKDSLKTLCFQV